MGELVLALMQLQTTRHRALARAIYFSTRINKSALTWRLNYRCTLVMLHSCAHAHTHECHSVWDVTHTRDAALVYTPRTHSLRLHLTESVTFSGSFEKIANPD